VVVAGSTACRLDDRIDIWQGFLYRQIFAAQAASAGRRAAGLVRRGKKNARPEPGV
jgi:hypothetical protein